MRSPSEALLLDSTGGVLCFILATQISLQSQFTISSFNRFSYKISLFILTYSTYDAALFYSRQLPNMFLEVVT